MKYFSCQSMQVKTKERNRLIRNSTKVASILTLGNPVPPSALRSPKRPPRQSGSGGNDRFHSLIWPATTANLGRGFVWRTETEGLGQGLQAGSASACTSIFCSLQNKLWRSHSIIDTDIDSDSATLVGTITAIRPPRPSLPSLASSCLETFHDTDLPRPSSSPAQHGSSWCAKINISSLTGGQQLPA